MTTQSDTILQYLRSGNSLTQIQATKYFNICCLAERIRDLRRRGISITSTREKHKDGYHVKYSLS